MTPSNNITQKQYEKDIRFLAKRQLKAGGFNSGPDRDTGLSSNSIIAIAYGVLALRYQELPSDRSDMAACELAYKRLPAHRKTPVVRRAMLRARIYINRKYNKTNTNEQ